MTRLDAVILAAGMILLVIGAAAYDWRVGALVAGLLLIASTFDPRGARR